MGAFVTPQLLAQISLAHALGVKNKVVLEQMIEEATAEGDYVAAAEVLELEMTAQLSDEELTNEDAVRQKVKGLLKLGELKWRYRVVDEGQNPRDEAIRVLEEAQRCIIGHLHIILEEEGKARGSQHFEAAVAKHKEEKWADELSECCQGLALARLIFNDSRSEDDLIFELLHEALKLRESLRNKPKIAETRNALGSLAQKQKSYLQAEEQYTKALGLRLAMKPVMEKDIAEKDQACAQSHTSLGNLFLEMGELKKALESLEEAKACYIKGFNAGHPKVAWALEAQANVHKKMKNFRIAQQCIEEAIAIRRGLQEKSDGKALFSQELERNEAANQEIVQRRASLKRIFEAAKLKAQSALGLGLSDRSRSTLAEQRSSESLASIEDPPSKQGSSASLSKFAEPLLPHRAD